MAKKSTGQKLQEVVTLTKVQQFYLEQNRTQSEGELAETLQLPAEVVRDALAKLTKPPTRKLSGFAPHKGVVAMTQGQSTADDHLSKSESREAYLERNKGHVHVIDPSEPVH